MKEDLVSKARRLMAELEEVLEELKEDGGDDDLRPLTLRDLSDPRQLSGLRKLVWPG